MAFVQVVGAQFNEGSAEMQFKIVNDKHLPARVMFTMLCMETDAR